MSRILVLPILFVVAAAFTFKQDSQKVKETFSGQQSYQFIGDTTPDKTNNVIVENIPKAGKGVFADTKNKIYLESDEIIFKIHPNETTTNATTALLIVNGKKLDEYLWKDRTIISQKLTVYPKNDKEAISLYGDEAARGTMVFEGARIIDKAESKIYQEALGDTVPKKDGKTEPPVFTKVEVEPEFDGNWAAFLQKNLNPVVPLDNGAPAGQYTVIAQFIVEPDGSITDLKTLTQHGFGMEEEVLKLMRLSPRWKAAIQNGRKVRAYKKQKITFVISEDKEQILAATDKLYIAIDNPIKLDVGDVKREDLSVSISQGSIHWAGSYYIARVNTIKPVTITVSLKEGDKIREIASRTFAADVLESNKETFEKLRQQLKSFTN